ncbi:MAG: glycogen synthase GlgA [Deltaproteobacteria bacterium]|nr:glycogen synthase GlgA [Deltaproteobacteria bacterium]
MPPTPPSVLFAVSECAPFVKAGGLGDVAGALPVALAALGHDVRVVMPRYDVVPLYGMQMHPAPLAVPLGAGEAWCAVYETRLPGSDVPVYMLDHHGLFGRGYLYDPPGSYAHDNLARFAFLSRGALQLCKHLGWIPDVVHVHDWPTALVPVLLNTVERAGPFAKTASVLTIHNLAHQSKFPAHDLALTQIPASEMRADSLEDFGGINPLKGGLYHATKITTVSPTYAKEIRTPEGGAGLHQVLDFRGADLIGILNGIDESVWDPRTDPHVAAHFDPDDLSGKALCKAALQRELGLPVRADVPLFGSVGRLSFQKGTDVLLAAIHRILELDIQMALLGSGDPTTERVLDSLSRRGDRFRAYVGFHEGVAHRIEAGADVFVMPSRFEPCGLNQMYSQRYGTLPLVRATGGLEDTVVNYDAVTGEGTGFKLHDLTEDALVDTIAWAAATYRDSPDAFRTMQRRAMRQPFGWDRAAAQYADVYRWAHDLKA